MKHYLLALLCIFFFLKDSTAQFLEYQEEQPDDPYIAVPKSMRTLSPAYLFKNTFIETVQVNVDENGNNILGDAANEPSIAIDPGNIERMAIGWRQFETTESNFRQAGNAYTEDGGHTWIAPSPIEATIFRSDPVLDTDSEGNFYYNSLTTRQGQYACDVFKTPHPANWEDRTYALGGDKQWMVIDKTKTESDGNIYASWRLSFSSCSGDLTRSLDKGASYENCYIVDRNPSIGTLAVDATGNLYVCGTGNGGLAVAKSSSAKLNNQTINWEVAKNVDLKGYLGLFDRDSPNPEGTLGQMWVATDNSNTATADNVYALASVQRSDNGDPCDVMFARSTDGGLTWSEAIRINDDNSTKNWQWFGTMSVSPDGRIDVIWLDARELESSRFSALFYVYSLDGGYNWSENRQLSETFDPHVGWPNQSKMGDYFHMISTEQGAHLAWAATFNNEQDVYYSFIPAPMETAVVETSITSWEINILPNPVTENAVISFNLPKSGVYHLDLIDLYGNIVQKLPSKQWTSGYSKLGWDIPYLSTGMYFLRMRNEWGQVQVEKVIIH